MWQDRSLVQFFIPRGRRIRTAAEHTSSRGERGAHTHASAASLLSLARDAVSRGSCASEGLLALGWHSLPWNTGATQGSSGFGILSLAGQASALLAMQHFINPGHVWEDSSEDSRRLSIFISIKHNSLGHPSAQKGVSRIPLRVRESRS